MAGGEPTAMPEFYNFLDRCIEHNRVFEFLVKMQQEAQKIYIYEKNISKKTREDRCQRK